MLPLIAHADAPAGLSFTHNDWQLVCDNTRTCRAAGYQNVDDEFLQQLPVSVLLTREAGPDQPVSGQVQLGSYDELEGLDELPDEFELTMYIDDNMLGQVAMQKDEWVADLSSEQVSALLVALTGSSSIRWTVAELTWELSDSGSSAVFLKMDEYQGRVGTVGALYRPGTAGEESVLPALEEPVVITAPVADALPGDDQFAADIREALQSALLVTVEEIECSTLTAADTTLYVSRLSDTNLLVSTVCRTGAYNVTSAYWVIDDTAPFNPSLVTTSGTDYSDGRIYASHKGRGLGDCWYTDGWTWDGEEFIHTLSRSTGLCRLIAPGGAWSLPMLVTNVRDASSETAGWSIQSLDSYRERFSVDVDGGGELYCETASGGEHQWFDSCASFSDLRERGCSGYTMSDIQFESAYAARCATMEALENAEESAIYYFALDSADWWQAVPAEVIPMSGGVYSEEGWELARQERDAMVAGKDLGELSMTEVSSELSQFAATLELREMECGEIRNRIEIRAVVLADFDNDGIADLLVKGNRRDYSESCRLGSGSSLGGAFTVVLSKTGPDQPIVVTEVPGIG